MKAILTVVAVILVAVGSVAAGDPKRAYDPTNAERARWTMTDMRSIAIALEAYKMDHKEFPASLTSQDLSRTLTPYIRVLPLHDAWGNPFRVVADGAHC